MPFAIRNSVLARKLKSRLLPHDELYNSDYFATTVELPARDSAGPMAESIVSDLAPRTVVDVGCGTGALLEQLRNRGCDVFGLEYSEAGLRYCRDRRLNVRKFNLERDVYDESNSFDVAISIEVAEHLPEKAADRYVDLLARLSATIVFTAAPPGQGGLDHVNEQAPSYWVSKFRNRGFKHDAELSDRWREKWRETGVAEMYCKNLMIFRRTPKSIQLPT